MPWSVLPRNANWRLFCHDGRLEICRWEPDICVGWEIQMFSWGYLLQRAAHLNVDLCAQISRIPGKDVNKHDTFFYVYSSNTYHQTTSRHRKIVIQSAMLSKCLKSSLVKNNSFQVPLNQVTTLLRKTNLEQITCPKSILQDELCSICGGLLSMRRVFQPKLQLTVIENKLREINLLDKT